MTRWNVCRSRPCRRGFTLVELLVVVGIIVLLVAILLPVLGRLRESGRTVTCLSNLRSIHQGTLTYAQAFDGFLPPANITFNFSGDFNTDRTNWWFVVDGYIYPERGMTNATNGDPSEVFKCPSASIDGGIAHYSAPSRVFVQLGEITDELYRLARAKRTSEIILAGDGVQRLAIPEFKPNGSRDSRWARAGERFIKVTPTSVNLGFYDPDRDGMFDPIPDSAPDSPNFENPDDSTNGYVRWRHGDDGDAGFAFLDGSAMAMTRGEVLNANMRPDR